MCGRTTNSDMPGPCAYVRVDLSLNFEFSRGAVIHKSPYLVCTLFFLSDWIDPKKEIITRSGTKTSPLNSSDMWGWEGPLPTGNSTIGESFTKRRGSPGTVATREQLGEPNCKFSFYDKLHKY